MIIWTWVVRLVTPYLLYIAIGAAVLAAFTAYTYKVKHDEKVAVLAKAEKEKNDAIAKGQAGRARIRDLCSVTPSNCTPDDWYRD